MKLFALILLVSFSVRAQDSGWSPVVSFTTGKPSTLVTDQGFDFGVVQVGTSQTRYCHLMNTGAGMILISNVVSANPVFVPVKSPMSILAYSQDSIGFTFAPQKNKSMSSVITITSNLGSQTFTVSGRGTTGKISR